MRDLLADLRKGPLTMAPHLHISYVQYQPSSPVLANMDLVLMLCHVPSGVSKRVYRERARLRACVQSCPGVRRRLVLNGRRRPTRPC